MQLTKTKVEYTEVKITMDLTTVRQVLAEHIKTQKSVETKPADICFEIDTDGEEPKVTGITATVLKRGRAQKATIRAKTEIVNRPESMNGTHKTAEDDGFDDPPAPKEKPKEKFKDEKKTVKEFKSDKKDGKPKVSSKPKTDKKLKGEDGPDDPEE